MARYQIVLAYDGTNLWGSQRQAGRRTAQGELETALRKLGWQGQSVLMAGRIGYRRSRRRAGRRVRPGLGARPEELMRALNSHLPVTWPCALCAVARADFHPRFDALARRYRYRLYASADTRPPARTVCLACVACATGRTPARGCPSPAWNARFCRFWYPAPARKQHRANRSAGGMDAARR